MKTNVFNENGYPLAASKSKFAFQDIADFV